MIAFEIEPEKPSEGGEGLMGVDLYIPANKEIIEALDVDMEVQLIMVGTVKEISNNDSGIDEGRYSFRFSPKRINVDPENEYTELAKEDEE